MGRTIEDWGTSFAFAGKWDPRRPWPHGRFQLETPRLKQALASSARWHSRNAFTKFTSSDTDDLIQAAISAGTASELILKALVFATSPALLAEKGDRDSLLLLSGTSAEKLDALNFRSISAVSVHALALHLHKGLPIVLKAIEPLRVRNAAAHLAVVDEEQLLLAVSQHVRLVEAVLPLLELDSVPYWGVDLHESVTIFVDEARARTAQVVQAKIAAARTRLGGRVKSLSEEASAAFMAALSGQQMSTSEHEESQQCPACGQQGWLICSVERNELIFDPDPLVERAAYPYAFECPVCDLELEGDELLEVDAFPNEIELEPDTDPVEAHDFEPDEDFLRGR